MTTLNANEELYEIKGDVADPRGTDKKGVAIGLDLSKTAAAHPMIRFGDVVSETDLFVSDDELMILMWCPRCGNQNRITSKAKRILWERNRVSIDPFSCTWPGCGLRIRVDHNLAREC
ncbi:MAG: hypothetical protein ABH877_04395 [bacterium]